MSKFILFGAGSRGEKFLIKYSNKIEIDEFWDNQKTGTFHGYSIKRPYYKADAFIVVTVDGWFPYQGIRQQLIEMGYKEFEDFIPHTVYNKSVALAYGNCHIDAIKQYLELHSDFSGKYGFYPMPLVQYMQGSSWIEAVVPKCELIIHQSIRRKNRYGEEYASEEILKNAGKVCNILSVPNLYGMPKAFFPQLQRREKPLRLGSNFCGYDEVNIKKWISDKISLDVMEQLIILGGVYSTKYILELWEEFQTKLEKREEEWDIKISDYIYSHYKQEKLFSDRWHISTLLAKEIAARILEKLGYSRNIESILPMLDEQEVFIYKDVRDALGLEFEERSIRNYTRSSSCIDVFEMDIKSYIEMCTQIYLHESSQ